MIFQSGAQRSIGLLNFKAARCILRIIEHESSTSFFFFFHESKGKDRISRHSQCHCPSDYSAFDTYRDNIPSSSVYSLRPRRSTWMEYYPPARAEARRLIGIGDGRVTGFGSRSRRSRVKFRFVHFSPRFFAAHAAGYRLFLPSSPSAHASFIRAHLGRPNTRYCARGMRKQRARKIMTPR